MIPNTFDLCGLDDLPDPQEAPPIAAAAPMSELEEWAEKACQPRGDGAAAFFDLESGPRPVEEIECFYDAPVYQEPEVLPPWDESMVKYGNAKKEDLRKAKRDEQFAAYETKLANEAAERDNHRAEWAAKAAADKAAWIDKAALSPVTGRVLLIGILIGDKPWFIDSPDEAKNLVGFWQFVEERLANKTSMIGHNSNGFDLPFLVRRSWYLGVEVPREVRQGRYWNPLFRDTMEHWNCGARDFVKLNVLGQFFGVGQKTEGVKGGDFHKLWFGLMPQEQWGSPAEQRAKAIEYNGRDLELTAAVAAKMGMV